MKKLIALLILIVGANCIAVEADSDIEYFALFLDGQKAGYSIMSRSVEGGIVRSTELLNLSVARFGLPLAMTVTETSIETTEGKPVGFESIQDMGIMKIVTKGSIDDQGKMQITSQTGQQVQSQTVDFPEGALMAEGLRLLQIEKGMEEGTVYSALAFSPSIKSAVPVEISIGPAEMVDLFGRVVKLTRVETKMLTMTGAIPSISYVDKDLRTLKALTSMAGMDVELVSCTKKFAMSPNRLVEIIEKTLVKSPVNLSNLSGIKSITYQLTPKGDQKFTVLPNDNQKVTSTAADAQVVTVKPLKASRGEGFPYKGSEAKALKALKASTFVQSDNTDIIELAKKVVGSTKDAAVAARKIELFVHDHISEKDFSIGYATAVDVLESKQGDCSEHAVLTAALCRAAGIPAEVVCGMLYVEDLEGVRNIFGGHAWTQVYIGGKWVYLDATRPNRERLAHIALSSGSGDPESFLDSVTAIGNFNITDVKIER